MADPVRQNMLARMGISRWQLRHPALLGSDAVSDSDAPATMRSEPPRDQVAPELAPPSGKLWLLAPHLPAPTLLADLCLLLGIGVDEVVLLTSLPSGHTPPQLWLMAADPAWPDALVCPLVPTPAQKRALWQQLRPRLGLITA